MSKLLKQFCDLLNLELRPNVDILSEDHYHPVTVKQYPEPWECLGKGNYAAVFNHPDFPEWVVKIYAKNRTGFAEEAEVYQRLGHHPAFSECYYAKDGILVLKRLYGTTLYDCAHQGIPITKKVIQDIDQALIDAQHCGLNPHDIHGKNVMVSSDGRGLVVDISDFLKPEPCYAWQDLKRAYYWFYRPFVAGLRPKVPYALLDSVRAIYRTWRKLARR